MDEYGYGYWFRFITLYPTRLWGGKSGAWAFVSRVTTNNPTGEAGTGDRIFVTYVTHRTF